MASRKTHRPIVKARTASYVLRELFDEIMPAQMSQLEAAAELDISRVSLAYWKSGRTAPDIVDVETLVQVLGYRLKLVKEGTEDETSPSV